MGGLSVQACTCLKKANEEQTEFRPNITMKNKNKYSTEIENIAIDPKTSSNYLKTLENNTSFSKPKEINQNHKPEIKIQTVVRAYLFRKKFFKDDGLKNKLTSQTEEIIKQKDSEFIKDSLLETDKIIKKDLNDDFLLKLETKETQKRNPNEIKIKTDCLITKDLNGEECLYKGELDIDGHFNGYGELYYKSGKKYEGKFTNGKLNGYGRLIDLFGIVCYEGIFKDNHLLDGKGKIININENGDKIIYEGDIKNMKKEGKGIEKNKEYTYLGSFSDNLKHGKGKIIYDNGDQFYEGDFTNGKLTGKGFYQWGNKCTYEGDFLDGQMHGKGIYKWPDGNEYEGDYLNNIKEGFGEYRFKNGKKYKGPYKNGKAHGIGVIIMKDGETREVEFVNGKIVKKNEEIKESHKEKIE